MKKERLTLKKLETKLEALKSARALKAAQDKSATSTESKEGKVVGTSSGSGPVINFGTMKSSLLVMYLLSIVVYIFKNMPFTSKLIAGAGMIYGKARVLKLLAIFRKLFVVFNAIIGVMTVYKMTGVLDGSVIAGITGLGNTYIEIFSNFTKKVFNWFFDLFDQ